MWLWIVDAPPHLTIRRGLGRRPWWVGGRKWEPVESTVNSQRVSILTLVGSRIIRVWRSRWPRIMYPMYHTIPKSTSYQNRIPDHMYGRELPVASCQLPVASCQLPTTKLQSSPMEAKCYVYDVNVLKERRSCLESVESVEGIEGVENVNGSREGMRGWLMRSKRYVSVVRQSDAATSDPVRISIIYAE